MLEAPHRIAQLIARHLTGELSAAEQQELSDWRSLNPRNEILFNEINDPATLAAALQELQATETESALRLTRQQIREAEKKPERGRILSLPARWMAAASILLLVGLGSYYYVNWHKMHNEPQLVAKNDVQPGHQGATLTLANGQKIRLTTAANGQLARQAGVKITKAANGQLVYELQEQSDSPDQLNTLSTANGETYQLRLPDGSAVWLNSASSLTYRASLNENGKRKVKLTGEAYFEVAKDKAHPFIVETVTQTVEVLGTHFNINSYADEAAVSTTLLEGSVKVTSGNGEQLIKPGEQVLNTAKGLKVQEADMDNIIDWKDGDFNFNRVDLRVALRKVARWYDVNVIYDPSVPAHIETGGWVSRNKNLSATLKFIESLKIVQFRIEGRNVYVTNKK